MKPTQLNAFVAVSAHSSIRGAARVLGVTPPAITKIIRELESELGVPLIERSVKGVELTEYGAAFAPRARLLLDDMRRARNELAELRDGLRGQVRVAVSTTFAQTLLVPTFRKLRSRRPGVALHLSETGLPSMLAHLREAQIDLAITHLDPAVLDAEFDSIPLFPVPLVIAMANRHPLRRCRHVHQLMEAEWALPGDADGVWPATKSLFASLGLPVPQRIMQGDSITAGLMMVAQMNCIGIFAEPLADKIFRQYEIRRFQTEDRLPVLQMCAIYRRGSRLTPAALQLIDCIRHTISAG